MMSENLRLNRIKVKNLFDRFTYDINLDNGFSIGILIAPNGCGKTTIFNLISFIFNPSFSGYRNIVNVPFDHCECVLSNKKKVTLKRTILPFEEEKNVDDISKKRTRNRIDTYFGIRTKESVELILSVKDEKGKKEKTFNVSKEIKNGVSHSDTDLPFIDEDDYDVLDLDDLEILDLPSRYRVQLGRSSAILNGVKDFLKSNNCDLDINYIRADRLHKQYLFTDSYFYSRRIKDMQDLNPLSQIQKKTKNLYKEITEEYNNLQREMKDRLPKMYLDLDATDDTMDFEHFKKRWSAYLSNIEKYCEIGLLTSKQTILEMDELEDAFNKKKSFLTVYLEAFEKTLEPLERNYMRLKLFVDILNRRNRITHKKIKYGEEGIVVLVDGKSLPLECLSSGEKNDFIMFYNLIFDSQENGLVLVDEPEISLHIEWQEEYLDCLLDICKMNDLQAIVATHSPNIVNGHFELYADRGLTDGC